MRFFELKHRSTFFFQNIDSTVLNEYASIVGLFFFSLFPERLALYGDNDERFLEMPFGTFFNDPSILHGRGHIDAILRYIVLFVRGRYE